MLPLFAAYLICGNRAPTFSESFDAAGGWDCVVARAFCIILIMVLGLNLLWNSLLEPCTVTQRRERLITISTLLLLSALLALTVLQDGGPADFRPTWLH